MYIPLPSRYHAHGGGVTRLRKKDAVKSVSRRSKTKCPIAFYTVLMFYKSFFRLLDAIEGYGLLDLISRLDVMITKNKIKKCSLI